MYLALRSTRCSGLDRPCAVKTIRESHADSCQRLGRFLNEARASLLWNHRNLCSPIDAGDARWRGPARADVGGRGR
ncbi:MAG: hypothetical protein FJ137_01295 [Deltaproteobacteria bacterium]|nr:hypothetical protein [Deltaproteobacteria bacterium]